MRLDDQIGSTIPIHSGLIHYFNFNDVAPPVGGDNWTDIVSTLGPCPVFAVGGGTPSRVTGLDGDAVRLESSSTEYLQNTDNLFAKGVNPLGSDDFTIAGWWRIRSFSDQQNLIGRWDTGVNQAEIRLDYLHAAASPSNVVRLIYSDDGSTFDSLVHTASSGHIATDEWTFFVIRRDGVNLGIDVNASGIESNNVGGSYSFHASTEEMCIGVHFFNTVISRTSDIDIDRLGFWDRALSTEEIEALYNNGLGDPYPFAELSNLNSLASGIVSAYRFGNNVALPTSDVITDNRNDIAHNGSPNRVAGLVGSGSEFNGTSQWYELADAQAADWEIGNREWTGHIRFKVNNFATNPMPIAKNNETGVPGGTEWNLSVIGGIAGQQHKVQFRAAHASVNTTHRVEGSGAAGTDWSDGDWHSVAWGFNPGSGQFIQVDDGTREHLGDLASIGTNIGSADFTVGIRDFAAGRQYLDGIVDSVHLWHRVLTEEEVTTLNGF